MKRIDVSVANVKASLMDILAAYPELAEDEQLALDTFEGETNLFEIASYLVKQKFECDAFASSLKDLKAQIDERKSRFERNADGYRKFIQSLMEAAKTDKLTLPEATISISKGRSKIIVDDVESLPQGYFKVERKADLTAIKQGIDAGEEIPGAHIEIGQDTLTIRTK